MSDNTENADKPATPDGVTVVILLENSAMGSASDFERQSYGGISLRDSQEMRARNSGLECCDGRMLSPSYCRSYIFVFHALEGSWR